ncbi:hypothetical protein ACTWP4_14485 [Gracilibacillus sp. D59]|uniref:hypothetical protein n=1 Tax=Gracilibacillus sp. D59 TaxID=3457434 RepID=UPI003FCD9E1A
MSDEFPNWLSQWLTFNDSSSSLHVTIKEVQDDKAKHVAVVEAEWQGSPEELTAVQLNMQLNNKNGKCNWKPHLSPQENMVVGDLVFRSPAIIFEDDKEMFALVPDIDFIDKQRIAPHVMDYVEQNNQLYYGLAHYEKVRHVYFQRTNQSFFVPNKQKLFRFYLVSWDKEQMERDFSPVTTFIWERFAKKRMVSDLESQTDFIHSIKDLNTYVERTYDWAFNKWSSIVWQEFSLNQRPVGGCVLVVKAAQSPNKGKMNNWREKKSIWNQAWFSSLRSAYGYRIWGQQWNDREMIQRSELAKNLALSAPQTNGLFPSVYSADEQQKWENGTWGHSDRRPEKHEEFGHLLDMSWTAIWMLKWYEDIEQDQRLLDYVKTYTERLLETQSTKGSFPAWVHMQTGEISTYLDNSPETSMHVWFLTKMYQMTKEKRLLEAAKLGMEYVMNEIVPNGRWEDFETYWSCSRQWEGKRYGEKDVRSDLHYQCNFSIYWTVEALKALYSVTQKPLYLQKGEQLLAELSLYQAVWEPDYLSIPVLGGFGVMNSDDEWNDARQSLFASTYYDYYQITGKEEYKYRGIWAMRSSFYMMYCPENPKVKQVYEKTYPYFNEIDYGFEMENAHHGENGSYNDISPGEFTIFDWGNGAAASALGELLFRK